MTTRKASDLTDRQREILDWIKGFIRDHGMPPTVREIGGAFDIKSSSVFDQLKALERKGHLERGDLGARSLILQGNKRGPCACERIRVVGRIAAGRPVEAIEHDAGMIHVEKDLLRGRSGYALKVVGESMVEAGILDGDYVIIRKQETAEDGDIVVALIGDEATLKRFHLEKNRIRLDPANKEMKPIFVDSGEFSIQGKLVGVHRHIGRNPQTVKSDKE